MSETPAEQPPANDGGEQQQQAQQPAPGGQQQVVETFDADYVQGLRREAAKYRSEAKAKETELERFRKASMTETERAIAEAEQRGRKAAALDFGRERARSRFDTLAARRNAEANTDEIVEFLDLARFVDDDGAVNDKALAAAVEKLVPEPQRDNRHVDYDQGGRETSGTVNMDSLIRQQAGRGA